jgi:hypothetical protein
MSLSDKEQKDLDILIKDIRINFELLDNGSKDMSPTIKAYILNLCRAVLLLYDKTLKVK